MTPAVGTASMGAQARSHAASPPSDWIRRFAHLVPEGTTVLDLACGSGRHMRWLAGQGFRVTGVDRHAEALAQAGPWGEVIEADLEDGSPWPLGGRQFGAVVVTNYLWRPLFPRLLDSVMPGGMLLYETFAAGNETVGRPSRPEFLLQPGELLQHVLAAGPQWRIVAYEDGFLPDPDRFVQRIAAVRLPADMRDAPRRHSLPAAADQAQGFVPGECPGVKA